MATLKVMQHSNGHIVRLAGDVHLEAFAQHKNFRQATEQELMFLMNIEEPLSVFLNKESYKNECFVVEKIVFDLLQVADFFPNLLTQCGMVAVPLITRLNVLAHQQIDCLIKARIACINKCTLSPKIEIIPYDVRSKYQELSKMSFYFNQQEHDVFCENLVKYQSFLKKDLMLFVDPANKYDQIFNDFIITKGNLLLKKINNPLELENFFIYAFANLGYLRFVAHNSHKNITLYLGIIHCHAIAQDLEKVGYKIIFEKGEYQEEPFSKNIIPGACSKQDYQNFFH
jgi:hypothetical protein